MGYCGEVSLIVAGLHYGQYLSQYDSRIASCDNKSQAKCEMLLGINDEKAATAMHLQSIEYGTLKERSSEDFLVWVKQQVLAGYPVVIGVFMNYYEFYHISAANAGDADYDHIVPVIGIRSNHPFDATDTDKLKSSASTYYADDEIIFSDNGLYGLPSNPPYIFNYTFASFQKSRADANKKGGDIYSLPNTASNYGIVITGLMDDNKETFPVRVDTNVNYEKPEIVEGDTTRPKPMEIILTVTVSGLTPNQSYSLYRYNDLSKIPTNSFTKQAANAYESWKFTATSTTYTMTKTIQSNEIVAFRCVKA